VLTADHLNGQGDLGASDSPPNRPEGSGPVFHTCILPEAAATTRWSQGTDAWPDSACNGTFGAFGSCNSDAQHHADAWATFVCQQNGYRLGVWPGQKQNQSCSGDVSVYCMGEIPCNARWERGCVPRDQTRVRLSCYR